MKNASHDVSWHITWEEIKAVDEAGREQHVEKQITKCPNKTCAREIMSNIKCETTKKQRASGEDNKKP